MPIATALLALAAIQTAVPATVLPATRSAAAVPAPATPPAAVPAAAGPPLSPETADERCLAAFAYLGGEPGQAAQASRYGTLFFYGKLMGRDPGIDLGAGLRSVVADIGATMPAEIARCRQEVEAAGHAMAAAGSAARGTPVSPVP